MAIWSATSEATLQMLTVWVTGRRQEQSTLCLGLQGAQGTGKSTLSHALCERLERQYQWRCSVLSLDDFYLGRAQRAALAEAVHPLLRTRGVPGTHDVQRGLAVMRSLTQAWPSEGIALPRFSKAYDDRLSSAEEAVLRQKPDLVVFEGWCVGLPAQSQHDIAAPCNELEAREDAAGVWRRHVNGQLAGPYAQWFASLDDLICLQAPDWDSICRWRAQQEEQTRALSGDSRAGMTAAQLSRFMQHYQRLTEWAGRCIADHAAVRLRVNAAHDWLPDRRWLAPQTFSSEGLRS